MGHGKRPPRASAPTPARAPQRDKAKWDDDGDYTVKRGEARYDQDTDIVRAAGSKTTGDWEDSDYNDKSGQVAYNIKTGTDVGRKGDDDYVAKDGDVYRHNENGWQQQKNDGGWQDVQRDHRVRVWVHGHGCTAKRRRPRAIG